VRLGGGRSELLLFQGWPHLHLHLHLHQVLEVPGAGPLRQEAGSLGQWAGWAQGASRWCMKVESVQLYFQQKGSQGAPPELLDVVDRKCGVGSGSSFHNMLGSLGQKHEIVMLRRTTMKKMRTMRRKRWRMQWWLQWLLRWL
jgi:hypothetical protein